MAFFLLGPAGLTIKVSCVKTNPFSQLWPFPPRPSQLLCSQKARKESFLLVEVWEGGPAWCVG